MFYVRKILKGNLKKFSHYIEVCTIWDATMQGFMYCIFDKLYQLFYELQKITNSDHYSLKQNNSKEVGL